MFNNIADFLVYYDAPRAFVLEDASIAKNRKMLFYFSWGLLLVV